MSKLVTATVEQLLCLDYTESPPLAYLAFLNEVAPPMLFLRKALSWECMQTCRESICLHEARRSIWPLSVVRLALQLARFAAQLISFEMLTFNKNGCRAASYSETHIEKLRELVTHLELNTVTLLQTLPQSVDLCEWCRPVLNLRSISNVVADRFDFLPLPE